MCWSCDNPGKTRQNYLDEAVRPLIRKYGWMVQLVEPGPGQRSFAYTVGLTGQGLPEFIITGLPSRQSGTMLNFHAQNAVEAGAPKPGEKLAATAGMPSLEVVQLDAPSTHLVTAVEIYGDEVQACCAALKMPRSEALWVPMLVA